MLSLHSSIIRRGGLGLALLAALASAAPLAARDWSSADLQTTALGRTPVRRPDSFLSREYGRQLVDDARDTLTAPLRWDRQDLLLVGGLGTLVAGSAFFDEQIRQESQENRTASLDRATKQIQNFGSVYSLVVLGGFEAYGHFGHDENAHATAMDGVAASIIASGVITPVLKYAVGRARPNRATHTFQFKPFGGGESFPSGHTTQAFAVASVIAEHYPNWPTRLVAYGLAGMVGYSRIEQNAHFASDVVAGAIIGTTVGLHITKRHDEHLNSHAPQTSYAPFVSGRTTGLMVQREF